MTKLLDFAFDQYCKKCGHNINEHAFEGDCYRCNCNMYDVDVIKHKNKQDDIFELIREERKRQDEKWGADRHQDGILWTTILVEEVGEVAKDVLDLNTENLKKELVQVAAVVVCWLESIL